MFSFQRIYDFVPQKNKPAVFVDRLYPRGIHKELFQQCLWLKSVTPSNELRKWFHQDPDGNFRLFKIQYRQELQGNEQRQGLAELKQLERQQGSVLLLSAVKNPEKSHIPVLLEILNQV
ncbi:uncharacterized protein YeaO (DUF488 family) [Cricetibacter osteomyelitidis]|uniref:Uncharacterized protein YeaO (DUF488 family) n=1 Tax=Cricetibacter osteomyelitidis TaxID=1521931 RepID=A0A4R2T115_9PAST|nr:DUF488 family protein [Cricetibacter osteomyelitidis]TCP95780.1 uncharacterized protein YeaO (DUF488 family) [Cricetibacter osteomyelitidis]